MIPAADIPRGSIKGLACSLYPSAPHKGRYWVLTAYYDESGTHGGSPITVMAGYLSTAETWAQVERGWTGLLRRHGLTHLHGKHMFHRQGEFKGWNTPQINALVDEAAALIFGNADMLGSISILRENEYREVYWQSGPVGKIRLDTRYGLCFREFMFFIPMLTHYNIDPTETVNFVLEDGHKNAGDALRIFQEFKRGKEQYPWRGPTGALAFQTKTESPALQLADLLAYSSYRSELDLLAKKRRRARFGHPLLAGGTPPLFSHPITTQNLGDFRKHATEIAEGPIGPHLPRSGKRGPR